MVDQVSGLHETPSLLTPTYQVLTTTKNCGIRVQNQLSGITRITRGGHEGHAVVNQRLSPISSKRCIIILRTKESFGNRLLICQMAMEDYEAVVKPLYIFVCST